MQNILKMTAVQFALIILVFNAAYGDFQNKKHPAAYVIGQTENVLGSPSFTQGGANNGPNFFGFDGASAITLDPVDHRLFVADTSNNRVLVYNLDTDNTINDYIADFVLGQLDFSTSKYSGEDDGLIELAGPRGLAYDVNNKRLFVSGATHNRIFVFDVETIENGEKAVSVLGGDKDANSFQKPQGLSYDAVNNHLYVADSGHGRVLVFDVETITDELEAFAVLGDADFAQKDTDGISQSALSVPADVDVDTTNDLLYVSDQNNHRILVFDISTISNGENAIAVLGQPDFTSNGQGYDKEFSDLLYPAGVMSDAVHSLLYVADSSNDRVMVYDTSTLVNGEDAIHTLGSGASLASRLDNPSDVVIDPGSGALFVLDSYEDFASSSERILVFDVSSVIDNEDGIDTLGQVSSFTAPSKHLTRIGANAGVKKNGLHGPNDLLLDKVDHRLFVADSGNNRVLVFNLEEDNTISDFDPDFVLGQSDFDTQTSGTTAGILNSPTALAYDTGTKYLFVAEIGGSRVVVFDTTTITNGQDAIYVLGQPDFTSLFGSSDQAKIESPRGIAYHQSSKLLFVSVSRRVLVFDVSTIDNGEDAIHVLGAPDYTSFTDDIGQDVVSVPTALALDEQKNLLFVSDPNHNRVMVFDVENIVDGEDAVYVLGQPDFTSSEFQGTSGSGLGTVNGMSVDSSGSRLFVSGSGFMSIVDIEEITNGEEPVLRMFASGSSPVTASSRGATPGLAYDSATRLLWAADSGLHRVVAYDEDYIAPPAKKTLKAAKKVLKRIKRNGQVDAKTREELEVLIESLENADESSDYSEKVKRKFRRAYTLLKNLLTATQELEEATARRERKKLLRRVRKLKRSINKTITKSIELL